MVGEMGEDQRRGYLRDEYLFLQAQYEDYDKRSLTIKGWVSGGAVAALAFGFNAASVFVPVMVAVLVSVIWYLEAYWKLFQYALADRIRIIEAYFRNDPDILFKNPAPFQIYHWWFKSYGTDEPIYGYEGAIGNKARRPQRHSVRLRKAALQRFVYLPYLPILALCALSFIFLLWGAIHAP